MPEATFFPLTAPPSTHTHTLLASVRLSSLLLAWVFLRKALGSKVNMVV